MADVNQIAQVLLGCVTIAVGWLFKTVIEQGKDTVALQTAFKFYLEHTSKGAARLLDSPNPTPPTMRALLRKYVDGMLTREERLVLTEWLRETTDNPNVSKSERTAAIQLLAAMETVKLLGFNH